MRTPSFLIDRAEFPIATEEQLSELQVEIHQVVVDWLMRHKFYRSNLTNMHRSYVRGKEYSRRLDAGRAAKKGRKI